MFIWASLVVIFGLSHLWRTRQSIRARRQLELDLQRIRANREGHEFYQEEEVLQALDRLPADRFGSYRWGFVVTLAGVLLIIWRAVAQH